nr:MAG TPA: hypothetical protein [Caudoviricetes sp.]
MQEQISYTLRIINLPSLYQYIVMLLELTEAGITQEDGASLLLKTLLVIRRD